MSKPIQKPPSSRFWINRLIEKALWETEGINPEKLRDMLNRSVRFTHAKGNRRYHDYLFQVEGHVLYSVHKLRTIADEIITLEAPEQKVVAVAGGARVRETVNVSDLKVREQQPAALMRPPAGKGNLEGTYVPGTVPCEHCDEGAGPTGKVTVMDPCEECGGRTEGCDHCDGGLVSTQLKCPVCNGSRRIKPHH